MKKADLDNHSRQLNPEDVRYRESRGESADPAPHAPTPAPVGPTEAPKPPLPQGEKK